MNIITNKVPRPILRGYEIENDKWRKEYDFLTDEEYMDAQFFMYKGWLHYFDDFVRIVPVGGKRHNPFEHTDFDGKLAGWDGIMTDSFFSGVLVKWANDYNDVIVGRYFC